MSALANSTLSAAVAQGSVGVSFSGAGFLIFYYIGVLEALTKLGIIKPTAKIAGASSGALITTSYCSGLGPSQIIGAGHSLAKACRQERSCSGNLDQHLRQVLQSTLPPHAWKDCRGKGFISISTGSPIGFNQPLLISDFQSQDDLIAAAAVSAFIPLWSASSLTKVFRGVEAFDGGYTLMQPCPPGVTYCVKISAKNPAWPQSSGIGSIFSLLGRIGGNAGSMTSSSSTSEAARAYPPIDSSGPGGHPDPQMLQLAAANNVDIAPGVFSKMPFAQNDWSRWALSPADDNTLKHMYKLGKYDAEMWAKHMGLQPPVVQQVTLEKQQAASATQNKQETSKPAGTASNRESGNSTPAWLPLHKGQAAKTGSAAADSSHASKDNAAAAPAEAAAARPAVKQAASPATTGTDSSSSSSSSSSGGRANGSSSSSSKA